MKDNNKSSVSSQLLVAEGKSSRLAAISNRVQKPKNNLLRGAVQPSIAASLKPEIKHSLQLAIKMIEHRIDCILNAYPGGKKKTFFKLKHGVEIEQIKQMAIKDGFVLLRLETVKIRHFSLIENLGFNGKPVALNRE